MKLIPLLLLVSVCAFSQQNKKSTSQKFLPVDSADLAFEKLWDNFINGSDCQCPLYKPGDKFPDAHPNAKYLNDTTLWEWREVDFGGGWKEKVFDLKPQYKDTLHRYDGSVVDVPIWIKDPNWKKPEPKPDLTKKSTIF